MAIEYVLYMNTQLQPSQASQLLIDVLGFRQAQEENAVWGYGLWVPISGKSPYGKTYTDEKLGIDLTLTVIFRVQGAWEEALPALVRSTMLLLRHDAGEAALLSGWQMVQMKRTNGELLIDNDPMNCNPTYMERFLSEVTLPYTLGILPQPLLDE